MRARTVLAAALAVVTLAGTAACRDSRGTNGSSGTDSVSIMVGGIDKVIYLPAKLTEQLGYFKAEGLDVKLLTEPSGATAENVLISGDVQGVVGFYDHTIDLQTRHKCITSVVQMADVPGEVVMVAADKAGQIRTPADFKGRKMGVTSPGSSTDFLTQYLATKAGLSKADYTTVTAGAGQTFIASLENGGIDAGMTTDPTVAQLTSSGKGKIMLDMRTAAGTRAALGGLYPATSLYMDCSYVAAHRATVQKLADALVKTLGWVHTHSAAQIAAKMPAGYAGGDRSLYVKAIHDSVGMFNADGRMDPAGARNVLRVQSRFNPDVKGKASTVDLSKTYTSRFVDNAG